MGTVESDTLRKTAGHDKKRLTGYNPARRYLVYFDIVLHRIVHLLGYMSPLLGKGFLFYRALGVELARIRECLDSPSFNRLAALHHHLAALQAEKTRLETLIRSVEETIDCEERNESMNDEAKFSAFKQQAIENNEATYGQEVRERYGDAAADETNAALMGLSCEEYAAWNELDYTLRQRLEQAVEMGLSPDSAEGREICELHRRWLSVTDKKLTAAKQKGIAELYVLDERFTRYYDKTVPGCACFLRDAAAWWAK